jgi:hypothetical protein
MTLTAAEIKSLVDIVTKVTNEDRKSFMGYLEHFQERHTEFERRLQIVESKSHNDSTLEAIKTLVNSPLVNR